MSAIKTWRWATVTNGHECLRCGVIVATETQMGHHVCDLGRVESGALCDFDDGSLQRECERRGWYMGAALMSDDQLRAECERRDGNGSVFMVRAELMKELRAERDEWKRRAEAAEAKLESMKLPPAEAMALFSRAAGQMRVKRELPVDGYGNPGDPYEQGRGISAKDLVRKHFRSDAEHYVDPWHFLEDA